MSFFDCIVVIVGSFVTVYTIRRLLCVKEK
jgi:hypothetical protein